MKKSKSRDKIIETASRLFYSQGCIITDMNQIIRESGVSKTTLYEHFHSKEELLIAYITNNSQQTDLLLRAETAKFDTPKEKALALFDYLSRLSAEANYNGCSFLNMVSEIPFDSGQVKAIIKKQKDNVRALFAEVLKPVKKEHLADQLYMLFDGALIAHKVHGASWPLQTAKEIAEKIL